MCYAQVESGGAPGVMFKTHPNINRELYNNANLLGLKDTSRAFPTGGEGVGLLRWRIDRLDESLVPLTSESEIMFWVRYPQLPCPFISSA